MEEQKKNIQSLVKMTGTISESFAKMKFVTVASLLAVVVTAIGCVVYTAMTVSGLTNKVYVLNNGQALVAGRQDVSVTRGDEVRVQSERFHTFFFTASPNRDVVQRNIESALRLCADRSAYNYYNDNQENGHYRRIAQSNAVQEIIVDSVQVNVRTYPYQVATYSTIFLTRSSKLSKYILITTMNMIDVPRDETNLNGLKVENFKVVRNDLVESRDRN